MKKSIALLLALILCLGILVGCATKTDGGVSTENTAEPKTTVN